MSSPLAKKPKSGEYREATVWLACPSGTVDAVEDIKGPAVRVIVQERYLPDENPPVTLGWCVSAGFLAVGATDWHEIMTAEEASYETKKEHEAINRGLDFAREFVSSKFATSDDPTSLYALLCTINDDGRECVRETRRGGYKEYKRLSPSDHGLALTILQRKFPLVFRNLNVAFRLRDEVVGDDTVQWVKGRGSDGRKLIVEGQCEKVSSEKRILLKASMGFAPHFLITLDAQTWRRYNDVCKARLLYHELSHIGYDSEKDTWFVAEHDITEFVDVVREFGLGSAANSRTFKFFHDTKQLDLLDGDSGTPKEGKMPSFLAARRAVKEIKDADPTATFSTAATN